LIEDAFKGEFALAADGLGEEALGDDTLGEGPGNSKGYD